MTVFQEKLLKRVLEILEECDAVNVRHEEIRWKTEAQKFFHEEESYVDVYFDLGGYENVISIYDGEAAFQIFGKDHVFDWGAYEYEDGKPIKDEKRIRTRVSDGVVQKLESVLNKTAKKK